MEACKAVNLLKLPLDNIGRPDVAGVFCVLNSRESTIFSDRIIKSKDSRKYFVF